MSPSHDRAAFERDFLKRLAPTWLACRWRVMGNELTGWKVWAGGQHLEGDLLGMCDYGLEMKLLCEEAKRT